MDEFAQVENLVSFGSAVADGTAGNQVVDVQREQREKGLGKPMVKCRPCFPGFVIGAIDCEGILPIAVGAGIVADVTCQPIGFALGLRQLSGVIEDCFYYIQAVIGPWSSMVFKSCLVIA